MPANAQDIQPTVFISYAHESDALRAPVKALAVWLSDRGCSVLTDHPYVHRPPERGWQTWMHDCLRKADVVLVVCTPKLKARYEKNEEPDTGFGATYEGAIVTQHIYDGSTKIRGALRPLGKCLCRSPPWPDTIARISPAAPHGFWCFPLSSHTGTGTAPALSSAFCLG